MITLSNGYQKPQNTDSGSTFFPAMEANIQRLNDHTHNWSSGTPDGAQLAVATQTIQAANWAAVSGGLYSQTITLPSGCSYDSTDMWFRLSTGEQVYPTIVRVSATQYTIYCNDNTKSITAFYR